MKKTVTQTKKQTFTPQLHKIRNIAIVIVATFLLSITSLIAANTETREFVWGSFAKSDGGKNTNAAKAKKPDDLYCGDKKSAVCNAKGICRCVGNDNADKYYGPKTPDVPLCKPGTRAANYRRYNCDLDPNDPKGLIPVTDTPRGTAPKTIVKKVKCSYGNFPTGTCSNSSCPGPGEGGRVCDDRPLIGAETKACKSTSGDQEAIFDCCPAGQVLSGTQCTPAVPTEKPNLVNTPTEKPKTVPTETIAAVNPQETITPTKATASPTPYVTITTTTTTATKTDTTTKPTGTAAKPTTKAPTTATANSQITINKTYQLLNHSSSEDSDEEGTINVYGSDKNPTALTNIQLDGNLQTDDRPANPYNDIFTYFKVLFCTFGKTSSSSCLAPPLLISYIVDTPDPSFTDRDCSDEQQKQILDTLNINPGTRPVLCTVKNNHKVIAK